MLQQIPGLVEVSLFLDSKETPTLAVNNVLTNNTQLEIPKLLCKIQLDLKVGKAEKPIYPRHNHKTPDNQTRPPRRDIRKYCQTHGAYDHERKDYLKYTPGYKLEARKNNILGDLRPTTAEGVSQVNR